MSHRAAIENTIVIYVKEYLCPMDDVSEHVKKNREHNRLNKDRFQQYLVAMANCYKNNAQMWLKDRKFLFAKVLMALPQDMQDHYANKSLHEGKPQINEEIRAFQAKTTKIRLKVNKLVKNLGNKIIKTSSELFNAAEEDDIATEKKQAEKKQAEKEDEAKRKEAEMEGDIEEEEEEEEDEKDAESDEEEEEDAERDDDEGESEDEDYEDEGEDDEDDDEDSEDEDKAATLDELQGELINLKKGGGRKRKHEDGSFEKDNIIKDQKIIIEDKDRVCGNLLKEKEGWIIERLQLINNIKDSLEQKEDFVKEMKKKDIIIEKRDMELHRRDKEINRLREMLPILNEGNDLLQICL